MKERNVIELLNEKHIQHCILKSYVFFKFDKSISCVEYLAVILRRDQTEELQDFSVMSENKLLAAIKLNDEEIKSLLRSKYGKYIIVQENSDGVVYEKANSYFREDYKRELSSISNNNLNKFEKVLEKNCCITEKSKNIKENPKNNNDDKKIIFEGDCDMNAFIDALFDFLCKEYRVKKEQILKVSKQVDVVDAVSVIMYVLHVKAGMSSAKVGSLLNRNHSTVLNSNTKVNSWLSIPKKDARIFRLLKNIDYCTKMYENVKSNIVDVNILLIKKNNAIKSIIANFDKLNVLEELKKLVK